MRAKMLIGVLMIVLVAALVGGATMAWFTSTATNNNNSFSSGTLVVGLNESAPFFDVSDMAPGDSASSYVEMRNDGSLDMLFKAYVDATVNEENIAEKLNVVVTLNPSDYTALPGKYTSYGTADQVMYTGPLSGLLGESNALNNIDAAFKYGWPLKADFAAVYKMEVTFDTSAGNDYQGKRFLGNLVVKGTQFDHQNKNSVSWSE